MRVLSFDQSTLITGWATFDDNVYSKHGMIDLHKVKNTDIRFQQMCQSIREAIDANTPDVVVIEDVMLMRSPNTMKILARLQGIIIGFCIDKDIPYEIYLPTEWRKTLGFKQGRVSREQLKQQAIELVGNTYKLEVNSDEADAICIAMAYIKNMEDSKNGKKD